MRRKPPRTQSSHADGGDQPPRGNREYRAVAHAIDSLKEQIRTSHQENNTHNDKILFWSKVTAAAVGIYTILTVAIVCISKSSVDATRESFTSVQRAFIVITGIDAIPHRSSDGAIINYELRPIIRNSGNTPTRDFTIVIMTPRDWHQSGPRLPDDPAELLVSPKKDDLALRYKIHHAIVGPQSTLPGFGVDSYAISGNDLVGMMTGQTSQFLYGISTYFDIFPNTAKHHTKFCYNLNAFRVTIEDGLTLPPNRAFVIGDSKVHVQPEPTLCEHWNCADGECAEDKRRYQDEMSNAGRANAPAK